jgi:clavulanate-9-aldehyde reducatase
MADKPLEGKVAAVTGASSGIGQATAIALAGAGAHVALAARRADRIEELARTIDNDGGRGLPITCDVGDERQAHAFIQGAHERLGGLDILVNNAGVMLLGPFMGTDSENWRRMVDVNVLGLLYCTAAALPLMQEAGAGHVVNVSSVAGRYAGAGAAVYNFTKFGVHGYSEALRQEVMQINVRVTIVAPGWVETELLDHNEDYVQDIAAKRREKIGKVLESSDIADAIVYATTRPAHMAVNEVLVRPTGER